MLVRRIPFNLTILRAIRNSKMFLKVILIPFHPQLRTKRFLFFFWWIEPNIQCANWPYFLLLLSFSTGLFIDLLEGVENFIMANNEILVIKSSIIILDWNMKLKFCLRFLMLAVEAYFWRIFIKLSLKKWNWWCEEIMETVLAQKFAIP